MQFRQARLLVNKFDECFRFYRDVIGLPVQFGKEGDVYADFTIGADATLALFDREEMALAIDSHAPATTAPGQDRALLSFQVDDLPAAIGELLNHNIELVAMPADRPEWGMRTAHFRDPDGNLIEIFVPIPMSEA